MKDLNLLKSENIKGITIYNIFWKRYRKNWNTNKQIKLDINQLYNFDFEKCNSHEYIYCYLKKYLEDNYSDDNDYFVDYFSFSVLDNIGESYKSIETMKKDDLALKIKN